METQTPNTPSQLNQNFIPADAPKRPSKKLITILVVIFLLLAAGAGAYWYFYGQQKPIACTQEAKQCPNGSYVSRSYPNCAFAECPKILSPKETIDAFAIALRDGDKDPEKF